MQSSVTYQAPPGYSYGPPGYPQPQPGQTVTVVHAPPGTYYHHPEPVTVVPTVVVASRWRRYPRWAYYTTAGFAFIVSFITVFTLIYIYRS